MPSPKFNEIISHINAQETDLDNVLVLIADLRAKIAAGASPAELDAVLVELQQNKEKLATALSANVPDPDPDPVPNPVHPAGTADNGDGTFTYPDGTIHNADGSAV